MFLTKDPFGGSARQPIISNYYVYVRNNPLRFVDLTGLSPSESRTTLTASVVETNLRVLAPSRSQDPTGLNPSNLTAPVIETELEAVTAIKIGVKAEGFLSRALAIYDIADKAKDIVVAWKEVIFDAKDAIKGNSPKTWGVSTFKIMKCNSDINCVLGP